MELTRTNHKISGESLRNFIENLDISEGVKLELIAIDPMGGAAVAYWKPIAEHYGLDITVVNPAVDPTFGFMTLDHDGKITHLRGYD